MSRVSRETTLDEYVADLPEYYAACREFIALKAEAARLTTFLHRWKMHPDFEYVTTDGPRKTFDESRPPSGEGWEKNTAYGRYGWERFDYHEEAYWRRPKEAALAPKAQKEAGK